MIERGFKVKTFMFKEDRKSYEHKFVSTDNHQNIKQNWKRPEDYDIIFSAIV